MTIALYMEVIQASMSVAFIQLSGNYFYNKAEAFSWYILSRVYYNCVTVHL